MRAIDATLGEASTTTTGRPARGKDQPNRPPNRGKESQYEVGAIQRAFSIIDFLASAPGLTARASEIADTIGLPRATAHRLLANLEAQGFVSQANQSGTYRLGLRLVELGHLVESELTIVGIARPHLSRLRDETGETTHLAVLEGTSVVYLEKMESSRAIRMVSRVGARLPAHITALGKAMLAYKPAETLSEMYGDRDLESLTGRSARTLEDLNLRLHRVRDEGYALDDEEVEIGLRCIGAPVSDRSGQVVAAVSLSAPTSRLPIDRIDHVAEQVRACARDLSRDLGHRDGA